MIFFSAINCTDTPVIPAGGVIIDPDDPNAKFPTTYNKGLIGLLKIKLLAKLSSTHAQVNNLKKSPFLELFHEMENKRDFLKIINLYRTWMGISFNWFE